MVRVSEIRAARFLLIRKVSINQQREERYLEILSLPGLTWVSDES